MSAELAMRTVGVLACATTLSLLTTIAAYAAVKITPLKWDGSFCTEECVSSALIAKGSSAARTRVAKLPARAS